MGYPTKALPQLRNETNLAVNLDEYEGSVFAAVTFMAGRLLNVRLTHISYSDIV